MKAWRLARLGGTLTLSDLPVPQVRPESVLVRIQAAPLLSYFKDYADGKLPAYSPPSGAFTPGTNGVGVIESVGPGVWDLKPGQRVLLSPHFLTAENVDDPQQILIGLTALGPRSAVVQDYWRDGTLAEYALAPVSTITPAGNLETFDAAQLAVLNRFIVPLGGLLRGRLSAGEKLLVNGATGAFGAAAVLLGIAMGAAQVIAAGRNEASLEAVARAGGRRVKTVRLTGDLAADTAALRTAADGGAHLAFDIVGRAGDASATRRPCRVCVAEAASFSWGA